MIIASFHPRARLLINELAFSLLPEVLGPFSFHCKDLASFYPRPSILINELAFSLWYWGIFHINDYKPVSTQDLAFSLMS